MATIDSDAGGRRVRRTNHELPLVPFIDFLLCLVTFLLATAGFANFARLSSSANVPGKLSDVPQPLPKRLHVDVRKHVFHVRNSAEYEDVIAVLDALRAPQRAYPGAKQACVFAVSFAAD